ncbi:MAG: right-handed parallel beta-helix repeat-containing protein [Bacteroidetes bacterium]|nr:right-handed parallel beta-helix repeat-containing protein [Bacteroidota bacterium]
MKQRFYNWTGKLVTRSLLIGIFSITMLLPCATFSQVNFTQTTDADFNQGVINNVIVANNSVYLKNVASDVGSWLTATVLPQTLSGHKIASWTDRYAYLVGGYNGVACSNAVYYASITGSGISSWTAQSSLPVALKDPAVVTGSNTIYVIGGRDGSQVYNTIYYAEIYSNGTLGAWQTSAITLPVNLWGHSALYLKGYIYITGGSGSMTETTALNNVYYAKVNVDNTISAFSAGTSLPAARNKHSMVTYNGNLYVMGGYNNVGDKANTVYIANPGMNGSLGSWTVGSALPVTISNHASVSTNGIITVMGGETASGLSNTVYYANADASSLIWQTSSNAMYDITKNASAFESNGIVFYSGGTNPSGSPIYNCRFAHLTLTADYCKHGAFVSMPFNQLGSERLINSLSFTSAYASPANCQVSYRVAGNDGIWGDWSALTATSPITVNQSKRYLQYSVILTGSTTQNSTFQDATLTTPGTQLSGDISGISTFTKLLSPYWATSDIWFSYGTHTFEAGATILFLPQTGLTVSQANVICNGIIADSVKFMYFTSETGQWKGVYFDPNSDNGVSSQFNYTAIIGGGYGSWSANLYCNSSNEPLLSHCNIRNSGANGLNLNQANINIQNSSVHANMSNGIYANISNPTILNSSLSYNGGAGVYLTSTGSAPTYNGTIIDHNLYGLRYETPNTNFYPPNGNPTLTANTYNGIAINGGTINGTNRTWNYIPYDYILLGTVQLNQYPAVRLTIEPGNSIKSLPGVQIQVSSGGELYAIGTSDSLITFTSHNGLAGGWDGVYFMDGSDSWGGQSQLDYCVIEKGNSYNYFSENTVQPNLINHTKVQNAALDGARYASANGIPSGSVTNSQFLNNGRYPLYILDCYAAPRHISNTYSGNGVNTIALGGGSFSVNRTIYYDVIPYYVLNDLLIQGYGSHPRLTINPGVIMEFDLGKKLQVGTSPCCYGGDLWAEGKADSVITFKPHNNLVGGWGGIYFPDYSNEYGSTSSLKYCSVVKGAAYNISIEGSTEPAIDHCTLDQSGGVGINISSSTLKLTNSVISNSASHGIVCQAKRGMGRSLQNHSKTRNNDGIPYHVFGDIRITGYGLHPRLTLQPGVIMAFEPGKSLQVGTATCCYGGDLYAEGKADSIITFKPYNNLIGGWGGIYFTEYSHEYGSTSSLKYCHILKGATYNINIVGSTEPLMDHCTVDQSGGVGINISSSTLRFTNGVISNSASHGIVGQAITGQILSSQFLNNGGYPLKYNDWSCSTYIHGNTYSGNTLNYIALSGGTYTSDITYYNDGIPYHVLSDIGSGVWGGHCRITLKPGITMAFDPGFKLSVGGVYAYGADLYAEGSADSIITFKPYNNTIGGWNGIVFTDWNDDWGGTSSLKYCNISKALTNNIYCGASSQPTIDHCTISESTGTGLTMNNSNLTIKNSTFSYNASYGIRFDGAGTATIGNTTALTCNIFNNGGGYQLYNNSTSNINARYNYWGANDSTMVAQRIYDKYDNSVEGIVYFGHFAQIPSLLTPTTLMNGTVKYANTGANPMKNAVMAIKDFAGSPIATATTNTAGVYAFSSFPSGNYKMSITPAAPWGGGNATDALLILNHFAMIAPLAGISLATADVNASHTINGTDALFVLRRFAGAISSFPSGDYLYNTDTVFMNGNQVTNNFKMACFGDCNLSYGPAKKSTESVGLVHEGIISTSSNTEFDFPVKMKSGMQAGAISLGFYYPEQYLEIMGATLSNGNNSFSWTASDGLFIMAWADVNALNIANDEVVVTLKMKSKDLSGLTESIALQLYEDCEFADPSAMVNQWVVLSVEDIVSATTGIARGESGLALSVSPNPLKDKTSIEFYLDEESMVSINLYSLVGALVENIGEAGYCSGRHEVLLDATNLPTGVYMLKVEISNHKQVSARLIKLVVSR